MMTPSSSEVDAADARCTGVSGVGSRVGRCPLAGRCTMSSSEEDGQQDAADEQRLGAAGACVVQKKSTPRRKPRNSGGSPSGVSEPPMFETRKMKNTTTWTLCRRSSLARSTGRIITIEAPVVPMRLASTAPMRSSARVGRRRAVDVAARSRCRPPTVNSASSSRMNGMYSSSAVCDERLRRPSPGRRQRDRHEHERGPEGGDLAVVMLPEMRARAAGTARSTAGCRRRAAPTDAQSPPVELRR